ncbi:MAG: OB-fold nucleic acid binding domain-containing protein, partial [Proteobacteria bacterium]|nr:OB-fold nucleic acid binding domain-containing protein [Pseudomonadota bacterium]
MSSPVKESPESTLERIMGERRDKGVALRAAGSHPYRNDLRPESSIAEVRARYEATKPAQGSETITPVDGVTLRVGGRVMNKRGFGKTVFAPIRDVSVSGEGARDLQLYLSVDHLDANDFAQILPNLDTGDFVVCEGPVFWTKRGELSILATRLYIVTKSLRPLPSKEFEDKSGKQKGGLTDIDARYRQRYVDLAMSPDVRDVFRKRSRIVSGIRRFLDERDYLEVETPMMHTILGGAAARPFKTHHNDLKLDLFMRIAPELYLKRLVVGGYDRVYEVNRNFRNEGMSRSHNPEFTMLEFYQAYATYTDLMDLTEEMVSKLAVDINGVSTVTWDGAALDLAPGWARLPIPDAVRDLGGIANATQVFDDPMIATEVAMAHKLPAADVLRVLVAGLPPELAPEFATPETLVRFKNPTERPGVARAILERYEP